MSLLDRLQVIRPPDLSRYRSFTVDGHTVGWVADDLAARLREHASVFVVTAATVELSPRLRSYVERTAAIDEVLRALRADGWFRGWRDEPYPVGPSFGRWLFQIERAA